MQQSSGGARARTGGSTSLGPDTPAARVIESGKRLTEERAALPELGELVLLAAIPEVDGRAADEVGGLRNKDVLGGPDTENLSWDHGWGSRHFTQDAPTDITQGDLAELVGAEIGAESAALV